MTREVLQNSCYREKWWCAVRNICVLYDRSFTTLETCFPWQIMKPGSFAVRFGKPRQCTAIAQAACVTTFFAGCI